MAIHAIVVPEVIPLKGKIESNAAWIWWLGKWRPLGYYNLKRVPAKVTENRILNRFRLNAGLPSDQACTITWEVII